MSIIKAFSVLSNAAQTPTVQDSCDADVQNTSCPLKNVWFSVCDFPSPVFPNMETTFALTFPSQPSFLKKSSAE